MKRPEWILFLGLGAAWGSSFMWIKVAVQDVGPLTLVAWRLLFGTVGMAIVFLVKRPPLPRDRAVWRDLALLGLANTALPFVLISWGEQSIDSAVASVLNSTVPLFALVIAHFALPEESINLRQVTGLLLGFGGVVLLMSRDLEAGFETSLTGQLAVLVASISYGGSAVFARGRLNHVHAFIQALFPMAVADAVVWAVALPAARGSLLPSKGITWVALLWLGLLGSCVAYILYFSLLQRVGPTRTTVVTYLMALFGVVLGVLFLQETLDMRLVGGAILVIAGVAVVNRRVEEEQNRNSDPASPEVERAES